MKTALILKLNVIGVTDVNSNSYGVPPLVTSRQLLGDPLFKSRGKHFAERASILDGHFWGALGQNHWSLVENHKILKILWKIIN